MGLAVTGRGSGGARFGGPLIAVLLAETGLKWPNDVLARGGKLAGILAEVAQPFVVLGVGLNVTQAPEEVDPDATSLLDLGVAAPDRNRIASRLLRELEARIIQWRNANPQLAADYRARSLTIGSRVRVELPVARTSSGSRVTSMTRVGCVWTSAVER